MAGVHAADRRQDIQILRGIAVLYVVLYHAGLPGLRAGYLGVDVFFVISGFLMMRILAADQDADRFSIPRFYLRRARRLLPAALVTIAVTSVLGLFVMARWDWDAYAGQAFGALTFTANIVAWVDGHDYFAAAAETRPLLHFWSLSLEEQFYLLLPFAVLLAGRRYRLPLLIAAMAVSIAACWYIAPGHRAAAFYLLPTRAWELLLGAVVAGILIARPRLRIGWPIQAAGAILVVALPFAPLDAVHPRLDALLVCVGTAAILLGTDRGLSVGLAGRVLGRVGDISYSLYLVHWPLLALATIAYLGLVPAGVRVGLVVVAFLLAAVQYRFVEMPFRAARAGRRSSLIFAGGTLVVVLAIAAGVALQAFVRPDGEQAAFRQPNHGLALSCDTVALTFVPLPECRTSDQPATALWGDSYMMQWIASLRDLPGGIVQVTRSACPPVVGLAANPGPSDWVGRCFDFHQSAFDYIVGASSITTVVLSGNFRNIVTDGATRLADPARPVATSADAARIALRDTIRALETAGKRVVIVAAAASTGRDIGACLERLATSLLTFGRTDCDFSVEAFLANDGAVVALLAEVAADTDATIVWPAAATCDGTTCRTTIDGVPLYSDRAHITRLAAPALADRLQLAGIIAGTARCTTEPADAAGCAAERPDWLVGTVAP